jgi:hypothetical protein
MKIVAALFLILGILLAGSCFMRPLSLGFSLSGHVVGIEITHVNAWPPALAALLGAAAILIFRRTVRRLPKK